MAQIPIRMPKMSMTMTEGDVSEWFVSVGDSVSEGDVICEVLTDKVDMEVESPATGVISSIEVTEGTVDVGTPIGYIDGDDSGGFGDLLADIGQPSDTPVETDGESASPSIDAPRTPDPASSAKAGEPAPVEPVAAVPRARGLARAHGVDLDKVTGSGPAGLVVMADVEALVHTVSAPTAPTAAAGAATGTTTAITPAPTGPAVAGTSTSRPQQAPRPSESAPPPKRVAQIRAWVAAKMTESASVPQFTLWRDLVLDAPDPRRGGISWTTVLLSSYAAALRQVPELLCRWDGEAPVESGPPSIGLAVATQYGLLAPVLGTPDEDDPAELDQRVRSVVVTAQTGRIDAAYLQVANGMLSNLGSQGVDRFQALVTPPQGSVLSVGSIRPRPVAVPGGLGVALSVTVGLTIDHRIADGAQGAQLLAALADTVTHWGESGTTP